LGHDLTAGDPAQRTSSSRSGPLPPYINHDARGAYRTLHPRANRPRINNVRHHAAPSIREKTLTPHRKSAPSVRVPTCSRITRRAISCEWSISLITTITAPLAWYHRPHPDHVPDPRRCQTCGYIVEEGILVSEVGFAEGSGGRVHVQGTFVSTFSSESACLC
jgi:hypothetical protein